MLTGKHFFISLLVCCLCITAGCSEKENAIIDRKFTNIELSAFTADTFVLKVSLGNEVITNALTTPEGKVAKTIFFDDYRQHIRVYNTSGDELLVDTSLVLKTGITNVFTIYQTQSNTPPFYLAPPASEPLAAAGYTKLSVIYSGPELPGSVKVVIENMTGSTGTYTQTDSFILTKDTFSRFFEITANKNAYVRFYDVTTGDLIGYRIFSSNILNPDFTISRLLKAGGVSFIVQKLY